MGTPIYNALVVPHLANLRQPVVLCWQAVPYVSCAVLWLPWRRAAELQTAVILAAALFAIAVVLYAPLLWRPGLWGGDMVGLGFVTVSWVTTAAVLVVSASIGLTLRLRRRASRRAPLTDEAPEGPLR